MKKYLAGIRFGMIVQFIIGPMCLLVFNTSKDIGFFKTFPLILVIALVDVFYISLAAMGVKRLLRIRMLHEFFRIVGGVILVLFGINTILNVFDISVIPGITISKSIKNNLLKGLLLALTNPITIMYWGSVLTTKLLNENYRKRDLLLFCTGLVSATIIFQTCVSIIGSTIGIIIPFTWSKILSIGIGIYIIYFGFLQLTNKAHSLE